ncbi:hypothetical protein GmRootV59_36700 [Variovorax sp. V59]|uniref:hypothetical protein n=1 Tax=unclassified Variovorax TaxID=663243 RepID=UPI0034E977ED
MPPNIHPNYLADDEMAVLSRPGILTHLKLLRKSNPEAYKHFVRDFQQFRRAENGERARPDAINNSSMTDEDHKANPAWAAGLAMPFAPRDTHRPDRAANPEVMAYLREANQRLEDEQLTDALQQRMGTDADRPLPPETLRDHIEAAVNVVGTQGNE